MYIAGKATNDGYYDAAKEDNLKEEEKNKVESDKALITVILG
jgi:hypothetical protein